MKYACWIILFFSFISLKATVHSDGSIKPPKQSLKASIKVEKAKEAKPESQIVDDIIYNSEKDTILGELPVNSGKVYKESALVESTKKHVNDVIIPKELKLEWSLIAAIIVSIFSFGIAFSVFLSKRIR